MRTLEELDNALYTISDDLINDMKRLDGDIIILGAGGKMGPSLARLAKLSMDAAGVDHKVIAVSRFGNREAERELQHIGIQTISADLIDDASLLKLPDAPNVIYMAGTKFGTMGNEHYTWAMNAFLPGMVARKFKNSKIVAFSTGNVYPLTSVESRGPDETDPVAPIGEYAQSCLGRERVFEHFSITNQTPVLIYRLNYAIDLRYGVLLEIGKAVRVKKPINLSMGYVNVIWQGDANQIAIRCLHHCTAPASVLNVTGSAKISVQWIAHEFGKLFGLEPAFENEQQSTALLSNASKMEMLFPFPKVSIDDMILMTAEWLKQGGSLLDKPTHYQERGGKF